MTQTSDQHTHAYNHITFDDKIALITGASSGLGAHFARLMAQAGARVVVAARRRDRLDSLVAELKAMGTNAMAVTLDVTDLSSVKAAFDTVEQTFGTPTLIANNAGVAAVHPALGAQEEDYDTMMDTNVRGVWRVATEAARRMSAKGLSGSIVNTASIMGLGVARGLTLYCLSKAGVVQLTKSMALELWAHGIRVNALCPGFFPTEMNEDFLTSEQGIDYLSKTPAGRAGKIEELSLPFLMLMSPSNSFMTGVALPVDGGHSIEIV